MFIKLEDTPLFSHIQVWINMAAREVLKCLQSDESLQARCMGMIDLATCNE